LENITVDPENRGGFKTDGIALFGSEGAYPKDLALLKYPAQHDGDQYAIPSGTVSISSRAFEGSTKLKSITIPATVERVNSEAFKGCTGLKNFFIPSTVRISDDAFEGCTGLESFNTSKTYGLYTKDGVLYTVSGIWSWVVKDPLELIKYPGQRNARDYVIDKDTTIIRKHAFEGCSYLRSVVIPIYVNTIDEEAFIHCNQLSFVEYQGLSNPQTCETPVFSDCPMVEKVCVPSNYEDTHFCGMPIYHCHEEH